MYQDFPFLRLIPGFSQRTRLTEDHPEVLFVKETGASIREFLRVRKAGQIHFFFAGEAVVPDFNIFDYAIGFDHLEFQGRYVRLHPLDYFPSHAELGNLDFVESEFDLKSWMTRDFCDYIYSAKSAHPMRKRIFLTLKEVGKISSYGKDMNNNADYLRKSWQGSWRLDKITAQSRHKFSIVAENEWHSGYTSEKIISSLISKSIPIYWGNPDIGVDFNVQRIIQIENEDQLFDLPDKLRNILLNRDELYSKLTAPALTELNLRRREQAIQSLIRLVESAVFQQIPKKASGTYQSYYSSMHEISAKITLSPIGRLLAKLKSVIEA